MNLPEPVQLHPARLVWRRFGPVKPPQTRRNTLFAVPQYWLIPPKEFTKESTEEVKKEVTTVALEVNFQNPEAVTNLQEGTEGTCNQ